MGRHRARRRKRPGKLSEAREVYEAARFFLDRGYSLEDRYVAERYKEPVDMFEKPYRFTIMLELPVYQGDKIPSWLSPVNQLAGFFHERGLLAKPV